MFFPWRDVKDIISLDRDFLSFNDFRRFTTNHDDDRITFVVKMIGHLLAGVEEVERST